MQMCMNICINTYVPICRYVCMFLFNYSVYMRNYLHLSVIKARKIQFND